jgi:hypothetical protein
MSEAPQEEFREVVCTKRFGPVRIRSERIFSAKKITGIPTRE